MPYNKTLEEGLKLFDEKITSHSFNGSCCYNNNENGKGHIECRYPYNPNQKNPKGKQCLKLREEHFDLTTFAEKIRESVVKETIKELVSDEKPFNGKESGMWN